MPKLEDRVYNLETKVADMDGKRIENIEISVASLDTKIDGCVTDISYLKGKAAGMWKTLAAVGAIITVVFSVIQILIRVAAG